MFEFQIYINNDKSQYYFSRNNLSATSIPVKMDESNQVLYYEIVEKLVDPASIKVFETYEAAEAHGVEKFKKATRNFSSINCRIVEVGLMVFAD